MEIKDSGKNATTDKKIEGRPGLGLSFVVRQTNNNESYIEEKRE